jgi:excisionase family DNA binding protein
MPRKGKTMKPNCKPHSSLLSVAQTAAELNVCDKTIRRLISDGKLQVIRVGKCIRISREALNRYVTSAEWSIQ